MFRENGCYLLLIYVVFTDVLNKNTNNNRVTYIAPKSLQTRLRETSIQKSGSVSGSKNKSRCHNIDI